MFGVTDSYIIQSYHILILIQSLTQAYSSITGCPWLTYISSLIHCVFSYGDSAVSDLGTSWYSPVPGTAHRASHETSCETSGYRKWQTSSHSPGSHTVKRFNKAHMKPELCVEVYMRIINMCIWHPFLLKFSIVWSVKPQQKAELNETLHLLVRSWIHR